MAKKPVPPPPRDAKPYLSQVDADQLGPADRVARAIIDGRRDLLPSVALIMDAGLDPEATLVAIDLFRASLEGGRDPHRDPRAAIAAAAAGQGPVSPVGPPA